MATMISGARGTANVLSNQLVIDMEDKIHLLDPDATPLATLLSSNGIGSKVHGKFARPGMFNGISLQKGTAYNPKHEWLEDQLNPRTDAMNWTTALSTVATTITVDNGGYFIAGQVFMNAQTKEYMRVSSVSGDILTVVRNLNGDASGFAITDNDEFVITGSAHLEGAAAPTANTTKNTTAFNYTQIFRRVVDITGTQNATRQYGGNDLVNQRAKAGADLMRDLEWSLFFGQKDLNTSGAQPIRTMGGVEAYVTTNVTDVSAALTEATFVTWIRDCFDAGGGPKWVFMSPLVMDAIAGFSRGKLLTSVKDKTYGVAVSKYVTPHGEVMLVRQPAFSGLATGIGGYAVCLDMSKVQLFHLDSRGPKFRSNIQSPDVDGQKDEFITESTVAIRNETHHGILKGITG